MGHKKSLEQVIRKLEAQVAALKASIYDREQDQHDERLDRIQELAEENKQLRRMLEEPLAVMQAARSLKAEAEAIVRNARPVPDLSAHTDGEAICDPCDISRFETQINAADNHHREYLFRSKLDFVADDWEPQDKSPKYLREKRAASC